MAWKMSPSQHGEGWDHQAPRGGAVSWQQGSFQPFNPQSHMLEPTQLTSGPRGRPRIITSPTKQCLHYPVVFHVSL